MSVDQTLNLGTLFTADITDFLTKVRAVQSALNMFATAAGQINTNMAAMAHTVQAATTAKAGHVRQTQQVSQAYQGLGKQISRVDGGLARIIAAMKVTAAYSVAAGAIYAVTNSMRDGVEEIIEYDQALKNLQAITGAMPEEMAALDRVMRATGNNTKFGAKLITDAAVILGQAGLNAAESMQALPATVTLAQGTMSSMESTVDLLTTTLRAFDLEAVHSTRVADVMANAMNKSKLDVEKLRIAFNYIGSSAAEMDMSLEQTTATMMVLADHGLRASTIGTGMRQVLARLVSPTKAVTEAFMDNNVALDQVSPKAVGFQQAMENLSKVLVKADGHTIDMAKAYDMFGLRGAQAAAVIASSFLDGKFKEALASTFRVGSAEEMAAIQAEGLGVKFDNLKAKAGLLAIGLGDAGVKGALSIAVDAMRALIDAAKQMVELTGGQLVVKFTLLTAAGTGLIFVLKGLTVVIAGSVAPALASLGAALLANPWALAALAIAGATVAMTHWASASERAAKATDQQIQDLGETQASLHGYAGALESALKKIKDTNEVTIEHESILERLKKDHPELAELIDRTARSYDGLNEVLGAVNQKLLEGSLTKTDLLFARLKQQRDMIAEAQKGYAGYEKQTRGTAYHVTDFKGMAALESERDRQLMGISGSIFGEAKTADDPLGYAQTRISMALAAGQIEAQEAKTIRESLIPAIEKLIETRRKAAEAKNATEEQTKLQNESKLLKQRLALELKMEDDKKKAALLEKQRRDEEIDDYIHEKRKAMEKAGLKDFAHLDAEKADLLKKNEIAYDQQLHKIATDQSQERIGLAKKAAELELQIEKNQTDRLDDEYQKREESISDYIAKKREFLETVGDKAGLASLPAEEAALRDKSTRRREQDTAAKQMDQLANRLPQSPEHDLAIEKMQWETEQYERQLARRVNLARGLLAEQKITADEYKALMDEAYAFDLISYEEMIERKMAADGNWVDQIKFGMDKARRESATWGETMIAIGENVADQLASAGSDAFTSWVERSKTAKEAIKDFAIDTLGWLGRIILRQQMLGLVGGLTGSLGGLGSAVARVFTGGVAHSGGVIGVDRFPSRTVFAGVSGLPRLHTGGILGLKDDEVPFIGKKREGVFTEGQMKALGSGAPVSVTVTLENKSGVQGLRLSESSSQVNGQEVIVTAVIDAVQRNAYGLRDVLTGG